MEIGILIVVLVMTLIVLIIGACIKVGAIAIKLSALAPYSVHIFFTALTVIMGCIISLLI